MNVRGVFNEVSLNQVMNKGEGNDRLGPNVEQKYHYSNIQLANIFIFIINNFVKEK